MRSEGRLRSLVQKSGATTRTLEVPQHRTDRGTALEPSDLKTL